MIRRTLACAALLLACLAACFDLRTPAAAPPAESAFGPAKVLAVHLDVTAKEYEAIQPAGGFGFGPPPQPKKDDKRKRDRNLWNVEFPWVEGKVTVGGKTFDKAELRYDGNGGYFASGTDARKPFRVLLGQGNFRGQTTLNLHGGAQDPSRGREAIAFAVFRACGVPAPRTAFAEVTLSVPGKFDKEYLGLYVLVEEVDAAFLRDRFGSDKGLLLRPQRLRGLDHLGDEWEKYVATYQPRTEATKAQQKRVIAFTKLVNDASDKQFEKEIGSYLDVDAFLRFLAANALVANAESFFALGNNYHLYLDPKTDRFAFIPGDLELSFANFLMMGTADQLMDMSITQPYTGPNKLADRLLADKEVKDRYQKLVKELTTTRFTKESLLKQIDVVEKLTKEPLAREKKAMDARKKGGPPGFGTFGAQPPSLRTFAEKRPASVAAQLVGKSKGYVPKFSFGPGPTFGGPKGGNTIVDDKTVHDHVKSPAEFDVKLFGAPPTLMYPVAISALPTGEVFVAVDEQGSLGKAKGGGRVVRCIDRDGDGKADEFETFARMEHPRGLIAQGNTVWVLHPPSLTVYHDTDGDGVADRQEMLVTGLTTDQIDKRGGDHTTNGIRMGIDGWIYVCVGDYGILEAKGKDGAKVTLRGGGIVRVRPDGTELEIFATGFRNPFDVAIDPFLNLFTRDNTNDGAGWDIRISHVVQTAHYGYTQRFLNFPDEIMPPLGVFGQGGGTGGLFVTDQRWPKKYRDALYTGDWGRSEVYLHPLKKNGPTFDLKQEVFLKIPRPTGMDVDGSGRLYVASWMNGESAVNVGPKVGFVARVTPRGMKVTPFPDLKKATLADLIGHLDGPNAVVRQHSQREILRRGANEEASKALVKLASDSKAGREGRVAALFTLKQLDGVASREAIANLVKDTALRPFALRALTDRKSELKGLDVKPFVAALADESPEVRAQAVISLSRLGDVSAAKSLVPLTSRPKDSTMPKQRPVHAQPDADRVVPHLAVQALVSLGAVDACLEAVDGPHREGALRALRSMHSEKAVDGLVKKLGTVRSPALRQEILTTLIRLYYREADYKGTWWGIRPDNTGPYYDRQPWAQSKRIGSVVTRAVLDADATTATALRAELTRHKVTLDGLPRDPKAVVREEEKPIVVARADPNNPNQIGNLPYETAVKRSLRAKGDAVKGKSLFEGQSCIACHTFADGQTPKGPHLVDIGKRYKADELVESILKPSAKIAQGFETYLITTKKGRQFSGFVVSESAETVQLREVTGVLRELKQTDVESRQKQDQSMMPLGLADALTPEQLADLIAYLQSLQ